LPIARFCAHVPIGTPVPPALDKVFGLTLLTAALGGPETTADALQDAGRPSASVTVQLSVVVPTGNNEPDDGVQLTFSGFTPPDTVGAKVSGIGLPSAEYAFC